MKVIRIKEGKNVKWRYGFKNKLIVFMKVGSTWGATRWER